MEDDPTYDITLTAAEAVPEDPAGSPPPAAIGDCENRIREAISATLLRHGTPGARIGVVLVDDVRIAELNQRHLQRAEATDVLAFDLSDKQGPKETGAFPVEGDLVISVETAAREARRRGHALSAETALYAVHGTLHLLGYDDQQPDQAARMHKLEDAILVELGMGEVYAAKANEAASRGS